MFGQIYQLLVGKWADPDGTAMSGQPVTEPEQAPELYPLTKISLCYVYFVLFKKNITIICGFFLKVQ